MSYVRFNNVSVDIIMSTLVNILLLPYLCFVLLLLLLLPLVGE